VTPNLGSVVGEDGDDGVDLGGRVHPKYLPQNFSKMTSVEVVEVLKNSILFDAREFLFY
jgi:hypothetical protein